MTPEQQKFVEENHGLIYGFLNKYHYSMDYYGDAAIGLCMAAQNFDPSFGAKFSTYAYKVMSNYCIRAKQKNAVHESNLSLNTPLSAEDETLTLEHTLQDKAATLDLESCSYINWLLESLPLLDLKIVLRRLKGLSLRKIGRELGCSRQGVLNHIEIIKEAVQNNKKDRRWHVVKSEEREKIIKEICELLY